jgi:hypothetical protein
MLINNNDYPNETFRALPDAEKLELMIQWFLERYEDPAQETPYNGREGGYLYVHGGPYNAKDQLFSEFADLASEELMDEAAESIEADGIYDWAPIDWEDEGPDEDAFFADASFADQSFARPDQAKLRYITDEQGNFLTDDQGNRLAIDGVKAAAPRLDELRGIMLERFDALEALLDHHIIRPGRWHNNPPTLIEPESITIQVQVQEIKVALVQMRAEATSAPPNPLVMETNAAKLTKFAIWLGTLYAGESLLQLPGFLWTHQQEIIVAAHSAAAAALAWAQHLPSLF